MKNLSINRVNWIRNNWPLSKNSFLFFVILLFGLESMAQIDTVRDYRIRINGYDFDPLRNPPQKDTALDAFNAKADSVYQLIQFKSSLTREQMRILREQNGLDLDEYIPNFTYNELVGRNQLEKIKALPFYRWNGNYEPVYKISRNVGKGQFESAGRKAVTGLIINVVCNKRINLQTFIQKLKTQRFLVLQTFDLTKNKTDSRVRLKINNLADIRQLASLPEVKWIEEEGDISIDNGTESGLLQSNNTTQTPIYNRGIRGEGQIIGLIDAPLDMNHCFFTDPLVTAPGPTHRKVVGFRQITASPFGAAANCSGGHGTHTAGTIAGFSTGNADNGIAFNSRLTYGDLDDIAFSDHGGTQSFLNYLSEARNDGAFVHSNSWSDKNTAVINTYTLLSQDLDNFTWNNEDQLVVVSSGNNVPTGAPTMPSPMRPPFTSKNGLCVAASSAVNTNNVSTGALGPTFDNRRKPEIYAPGSNTTSSRAGTNCATFPCGGSSMATPMIAAAGALVRQYYTEGWYPSGTKRPDNSFVPSGALLKATLLNSTRDMTGIDAFGSAATINGYPTNLEGWGELVLDDALYYNGDARNLTVWDVRHAGGLNTGEQDGYTLNVTTNTQPLKITLTWLEPPAANANFGNPVTNNLDLRVIAPDGTTVFRGNNFNAGQSLAGDAVTDQVNNVEMVLVNTPQTGQWRIQVIGTAVNQGNPSQGYALVATADTEEPPAPTGTQNTLVVLTELPGTNPAGAPSQTNATNLMTGVNAYITEASYGTTTINPGFVNVTLSTPLGTYLSTNHNPLIEMTQDVVTQLVAANPNVFTLGTPATTDDIDRIVILINDRNFTGDWATTGGWPYDLPDGLTSRLSVSVSSVFNDPDQRLAHAMCHQLGLMDLYNHPGVTFAQPHVDNWDIMSNLSRVQPMAWSKEKALWLSTNDPNSILWIPRPAAGVAFDQSIALNFLSSANTTNRRAIAIGLTPNVTAMANENVFFFIEARSNAAGTADGGLPGSGVLLYYVNQNIRQGEGPARIIDRTTGTATLDDAQLSTVGQAHDLLGSYGLRVTRIATTGTEDTKVRVEYDPIETQNDVNIVAGDPYYTSPDIWVDAPDNGYDVTPGDHGEQPVTGTNRIYFRIHNPGPGTAFDVTVSVRLSEPYHTVGGEGDFNRFVAQKFYASIAPGASGDIVDFVEWTPVAGAEPHNCVKVIIESVFNDINSFNNTAQENIEITESRTASPYEPVTFHFSATNPYDYYQLMYFRAENLPRGWTATFSEPKRLFIAHERFEGTLTVQPPDTATVCTDHQIFVTSWMPKGNTLIQLGGSTLQVDLRNRTTLTATTTGTPCTRDNKSLSSGKYSNAKCYTLITTGCTNPVRANEDIIIRYDDPDGNPVYRTVRTDAMGCYSDTYVVTDGGEWKVTVKYPGSKCEGSSTTGVKVVVPLPSSTGGTGQGGNGLFPTRPRNIWYSFHVGSSHPLGSLNNNADANIYAMADLTYPINTSLNLQLLIGIAQMTNSSAIAGNNPKWTHISANVQRIFPRVFDMKPYLRAGVGVYSDFANNTTMGVNMGLGGIIKMSNQLFLSPGIDLHVPGLSSKDQRSYFITAHIGIIFK